MALVTTSLVVDFGGALPSMLKAEIDSRPAGLNSGNTSFVSGDNPAYLIYKTGNVTITQQIPSLGTISSAGGSIIIPQEEFIEFSNVRTASTSYPVASGFTYEWFGNSLGAITVQNETELVAGSVGVAVARITYNTVALPYRLLNVPGTVNGRSNFPVQIYIAGEATE